MINEIMIKNIEREKFLKSIYTFRSYYPKYIKNS